MNVNRSVFHGSKERSRSVISDDTKKQANNQRQSEDVNKAKIIHSNNDNSNDAMTFKSKVIEIMPNEGKSANDTLTALRGDKPFRSRAPTEKDAIGPSAPVRMSTGPSRIRIRSYHGYDDIETTLAKITSSQRTICTALTSLM